VDLSTDDARASIARWLEVQARYCDTLGSPLYGALLPRAADDARAGGPVFEVMRGHQDDPPGSALALRFMGAVHRLVLSGGAAALAPFYPSVAGKPVDGDPWPAFRAAVAGNVEQLRSYIELPVQTNEVGRSATLLGGFLTVAREFAMPLRVLEIGSSAGLNLRWDRYRYESGTWSWGDEGSLLRFASVFEDATPSFAALSVVERAGSDPNPIDPLTEEGRLTLMSYVWPDQTSRFRQLRDALRIAAAAAVSIERAPGPAWLAGELGDSRSGVATVVFHSIVMQYLGEAGRNELVDVLTEAGVRATRDAPLAWLRFEPSRPDGGGRFQVHLTTWPGGDERLLAESHPHGPPVRWLA
jgi:hypothetical protein